MALLKHFLKILGKDEDNKEAVAILKQVVDKEEGAETDHTKHDKAESLGGHWADMEKHLKEEETTVAKIKKNDSNRLGIKGTVRGTLAAARTATRRWKDLNEARKRGPDEEGDERAGEGAQRLERVPGPTPQDAQQQMTLAKANPKPEGTDKPAAKAVPAARKARRTDGKKQDGDIQMDTANGDSELSRSSPMSETSRSNAPMERAEARSR